MKIFKPQRGFTLIELLVVVAIIGILAGIILVSLGNARQSGADAGIKGNLANLRTQSEIYAGNNGNSYDNYCTNANAARILAAAVDNSGISNTTILADAAAGAANRAICHDSASGWVAAVPLRTNPANFWCVDGDGTAGIRTTLLTAPAIVCPAS